MDIEDAIAGFAVEVVVVLGGGGCQFVAVGLPWDADGDEGAVFGESADGAVDGAEPEGRGVLAGVAVDFIDRERAACVLEGGADGALLLGVTACGHLVFLGAASRNPGGLVQAGVCARVGAVGEGRWRALRAALKAK